MSKYVAYYCADNLMQKFETVEEAKKWLNDLYGDDADECISEETIKGLDFIAKIEFTSKYTVTDKKENYKLNEEGELINKDGDEWVYSVDCIGDVELVKEEE